MIREEIEFHAPTRLADALALLGRLGEEAIVLGGGMSLLPAMNLGLARPPIVISLNHIPELAGIYEADDELRIGGTTRHADILASPVVAARAPVLAEAAGLIGDVQVRNRGTIGGSCAHADPAADYLPVLSALGASFVLRSESAERLVSSDAFFVGALTTALHPDEIIAEVRIPFPEPGSGAAYRRLSKVKGSFPIVSAVAVATRDGSATIAIGGVHGTPVLLAFDGLFEPAGNTEAGFDTVAARIRETTADGLQDLNADAEYRSQMAVVYSRRALEIALNLRS